MIFGVHKKILVAGFAMGFFFEGQFNGQTLSSQDTPKIYFERSLKELVLGVCGSAGP